MTQWHTIDDPERRGGFQFLAEVPRAWGRVIKLEPRGNVVLVHTESGNTMIVGIPPPPKDEGK
jgi:hypothetical protein